MYKTLTSLGALALLTTTATAHGVTNGVTIDGTYIGGFKLDYYYAAQNNGPIPAHIGWYAENLDNGFVEPAAFSTPDIICHKAGSPKGSSDTLAKVAAGGVVEFHWSEWPESHVGPVITYVAPYTGDISSVKKESLKWTKIDAAGYEDGEWAAVKLIGQNNTWPVTVPKDLKAGKYVFRHEIIALHGAGEKNGAQNYPQCLNIEVTGDGAAEPEGVVGTKLYTEEEDGIIFNPYAQEIKYNVPGPALWTGGSTPSTPSTPANSTTPSTPSSAPIPSSNATLPISSPTPSPIATPTEDDDETPASGPSTVPSAPAESGSALPETFTLDSFIAWLEGKASGSKTRRHARSFSSRANRVAVRGYY